MIPCDWLRSLGVSTRVAILDSGFEPYTPDLVTAGMANFTHKRIDDNAKHGTAMAQVIANRAPQATGIAPYCDLYIGKVWSGPQLIWPHFEAGLEWALSIKAQVVSMSFGINKLSDRFLKTLQQLDEIGTICVAACCGLPGFRQSPHIILVDRLGSNARATVATVDEYTVCGPNVALRRYKGTSVSTAIIAGIAAGAKSVNPQIDRKDFVQKLNSSS